MAFGIHKGLDDPETYYGLAVAGDLQLKKEPVQQAVDKRMLPYRLLNDLQKQADNRVKSSTIKEVIKASAVCAPVLHSSLRQQAREGKDMAEPFPLLLTALLGEISGPEAVSELLELADHEYKCVCMHSAWANWRLGQRHPKEALRNLRDAVPAASSLLRGRIGEQLAYFPQTPGVTEALVSLLDGFESRKKDEDAETLLAIVATGLIERNENDLARGVLARHSSVLSKEGRAWIKGVFEDGGRYETILATEGVAENDINDICLGRAYIDDFEDDDFPDEPDFDEPDFDEPGFDEPPPPPKPKIGRNEPCWCGSGKKYKKCHLASDEESIPMPAKAVESGGDDKMVATDLARRIINSSDRWHRADDLARAKREYFQNDPTTLDPGEENGYLQWFAHDFRASRTNKSLVEHMWETDRGALSLRTLEILEAWRNSYAGIFEVMRSEKGGGLELRNIASDEAHFVYDVMGSGDAEQGDWILSRLEWLDGRWQLVSDGFKVQHGLEARILKYIQTEAEAAGETPDDYVRRNGNRLYRVLLRMGLGPVH